MTDRHGVGSEYSTYETLPGDVQHLLNPIVGIMRLLQRDGEMPNDATFEYWIDRLQFTIERARNVRYTDGCNECGMPNGHKMDCSERDRY